MAKFLVIFQTTSQFCFKFCMTFQCHKIYPLCTFLSQTLHILHKGNQSKWKWLLSAQINIHQILVIFETKNKFFFKFCTTLGIMRHISSRLFLAETLYAFRKSSLSKYKFGEFSPEQSEVWNFALWCGSFCKNGVKFHLKKYRRLISHDIEEWCKV